jgi:hypothetical protein
VYAGRTDASPSATDVCDYFGCKAIAVIAELTAEHDRLRELDRDLAVAATARDRARSSALAARMQAVLGPHTAVEDVGLFPAFAGEYAGQMALRAGEHRDIDGVLSQVAGGAPPDDWPDRVLSASAQLFEHNLGEQDGVFPAALATLDAEAWEAVSAARLAAGSGMTPVADPA